MSRKPFVMVALSLAAVVSLNACGSDSDSDDTVADATTTVVSDVSESTPDPTTEVATPDATTEVTSPDATTDVASTDATTPPTADPDASETSDAADGGEVCEALQVISDYDAQSNEVIAGDPTFAELQAFLTDTAPSVLQAYDDAAAADPDLATDAATLREFTSAAVDAFADADTQEEATATITTIPNAQAAGSAGQRLNEYATTNCGFPTSNAAG